MYCFVKLARELLLETDKGILVSKVGGGLVTNDGSRKSGL